MQSVKPSCDSVYLASHISHHNLFYAVKHHSTKLRQLKEGIRHLVPIQVFRRLTRCGRCFCCLPLNGLDRQIRYTYRALSDCQMEYDSAMGDNTDLILHTLPEIQLTEPRAI